MNPHDLALIIDHTNLRPDATEADLRLTCEEAIKHKFCAVVCNPARVQLVASLLEAQLVMTVTVAGFPLGANRTEVKVAEAIRAAIDGANEIDLVANIGWLLEDRFDLVSTEIREVRKALPEQVGLKVIIETALLSPDQQATAVAACVNGGAQFVKSSTGFHGGATIETVRHLVEAADGKISVKASGGIKTLADCRAMIAAGADRIGCSASIPIMKELLSTGDRSDA